MSEKPLRIRAVIARLEKILKEYGNLIVVLDTPSDAGEARKVWVQEHEDIDDVAVIEGEYL